MSPDHDKEYLAGLVHELCKLPRETECVESKRNRYEPQLVGEYLSTLASVACLAIRPQGYLAFGIDDEPHEIGAQFYPYPVKAKDNPSAILAF